MPPPPLPPDCAGCAYSRRVAKALLCVRHGPSPSSEDVTVAQTFEVVEWPHVRPQDRCGAGASRVAANAPTVSVCESCIHWLQPGGIGVIPDFPGERTPAWWTESGFCTRFAPSPGTDQNTHTQWKVTHRLHGCGDGEPIEDEGTDADEAVQELHPVQDAINGGPVMPLMGPR